MVRHMRLSNTSTMLIAKASVPVLVHIYLTGYIQVDISWMDIWIPQHIIIELSICGKHCLQCTIRSIINKFILHNYLSMCLNNKEIK